MKQGYLMGQSTIQGLECLRCGYSWIPRTAEPRQCPGCKSVRWDTPRGQSHTDTPVPVEKIIEFHRAESDKKYPTEQEKPLAPAFPESETTYFVPQKTEGLKVYAGSQSGKVQELK